MDLSFRSEEGEGCESESQKFFIVFESRSVSIISVEFEEESESERDLKKNLKLYKFNENVRFIESLNIYIERFDNFNYMNVMEM